MESAFSVLVGAGLRWGQGKMYLSLRLKVALNVLAHNLRFIDLSGSFLNFQSLPAVNKMTAPTS